MLPGHAAPQWSGWFSLDPAGPSHGLGLKALVRAEGRAVGTVCVWVYGSGEQWCVASLLSNRRSWRASRPPARLAQRPMVCQMWDLRFII